MSTQIQTTAGYMAVAYERHIEQLTERGNKARENYKDEMIEYLRTSKWKRWHWGPYDYSNGIYETRDEAQRIWSMYLGLPTDAVVLVDAREAMALGLAEVMAKE